MNLTEQMGLAGLEVVRWEDMLTSQEQVGSQPAGQPASQPARHSRRTVSRPFLPGKMQLATCAAQPMVAPPTPAAAARSWPGSDGWRCATTCPSCPA